MTIGKQLIRQIIDKITGEHTIPVNVEIFGDKLRYAKFGTGPRTMVIIPGISVRSVLGAADVIGAAFGHFTDYHFIVFDEPTAPEAGYTLWDYADAIAQVLDELGVEHADFYGASMGGMTCQCMAIRHPDKVHKMVLAATTSKLEPAVSKTLENWIRYAENGDVKALAEASVYDIYSKKTIETYGEMMIGGMMGATPEDLARFAVMGRAVLAFDVTKELPKVTCPILVIGSRGDKVLGYQASEKITDLLDCALHMYGEEFGHGVYDEAPDFKSRMMDFFINA